MDGFFNWVDRFDRDDRCNRDGRFKRAGRFNRNGRDPQDTPELLFLVRTWPPQDFGPIVFGSDVVLAYFVVMCPSIVYVLRICGGPHKL